MLHYNFINLLFLVPLAIIGLICSYTDIKYNKIFNKWIAVASIYILFLYIALFVYTLITGEANINYIFILIINGLLALVGGYLLWNFKLWSAGDAKLFTVYAFLIPLNFYSKSYIPYFPSFNLLINLFIPLLILLSCNAIFITIRGLYGSKHKIKKVKLPEAKRILKYILMLLQMYLSYILIFLLLQLLFFISADTVLEKALLNPLLLFMILLLIGRQVNKIRQIKKWINFIVYGFIIGYGVFLFFSGETIQLKNMLMTALVFMVFIGITRKVLNFYIEHKETQKIKISNVKEGMILAENEAAIIFNKLNNLTNALEQADASGISQKQAYLIKELFKESPEKEVRIYNSLPFAPFLFLSAIISIITQSSFLPIINNFLKYLIFDII